MARKKGNFVDTTATVESDGQAGMFSVPGAQIIEVEQESWLSIFAGWFKSIILFLALAAAVLAVLYSGLSATIMVFSPVGSSQYEIVIRNAWADEGGIPPEGTLVAVSPTDSPQNWWEWITVGWLGIPNASEAKIVSTNYDKLYIAGPDSENLTVVNLANESVNGKFWTSKAIPVDEDKTNIEFNHVLKNQYLVECVAGACAAGNEDGEPVYFVVDETQIYGEVR